MSIEAAIRDYVTKRVGREELLAQLATFGVTQVTAVTMVDVLDHAAAEPGAPNNLANAPRALSRGEYRTIEAIAGRIIPGDDTPGAIEAGAADYIDFALARAYRIQLVRYRSGIAALDRYCTVTYGRQFAVLDQEQQDRVLETMEAGRIDEFSGAADFFALVRRHVMEGFLCEPFYGGNRDMIGWKLVGFPGMRYGYDDAYNNKRIDLAPVAGNHPPRKGE